MAFIHAITGLSSTRSVLFVSQGSLKCGIDRGRDAVLSRRTLFATKIGNSVERRVVGSGIRMSSGTTSESGNAGKLATDRDPKDVSENEWRQVLTNEEFRIIRQKGTEYPGTGEYDGFYPKEGHFVCRACGNPLYSASSKFKSGCGWPAFDMCYKGSVATNVDMSFNQRRIEILCAKCGGHLGHVFEGERMTPTNERHCVNSVSVKYVAGSSDQEEGKLL